MIEKVFDQYVDFVSLEDHLFTTTLFTKKSELFYNMLRNDVSKEQIDLYSDQIVESLFSVFVTAKVVPIIRCQSKTFSEAIAEKLDKKFRDSLRDSNNGLFLGSDSFDAELSGLNFQSPILILVDRMQDMITPLHHPWKYQSLIDDLYTLDTNRIEFKKGERSKTVDLSPQTDSLWVELKELEFNEVASSIQKEVENLKKFEKEMNELRDSVNKDPSQAAIMDDELYSNSETPGFQQNSTDKLSNAIDSLPKLLDRKRCLDLHTNMATEIANTIKDRKIDFYNHVEEKIIFNQKLEEDEKLTKLLGDSSFGTSADRLRLLLIAALNTRQVVDSNQNSGQSANDPCGTQLFYLNDNDFSRSESAFKSSIGNEDQIDLRCIEAIKRLRKIMSLAHLTPNNQTNNTGYSQLGFSKSAMFSKLVSHGSMLLENMRNIVDNKQFFKITRIVQALMENKAGQEFDDYNYYDPKFISKTYDNQIPRYKQSFNDAYVFIVGGGTFTEYLDICDLMKKLNYSQYDQLDPNMNEDIKNIPSTKFLNDPSSRKIYYGCTDLISPIDFLSQLSKL